MATDFAPDGGTEKIPCAKEAPDYRPARWSSKARHLQVGVAEAASAAIVNGESIVGSDHDNRCGTSRQAEAAMPQKLKKPKRAKNSAAAKTGSASAARAVAHYHVHVYYDPAKTRGRAERLRDRVAAEFPQAKLGRWHDELVGPHPQSMYQIAFPSRILKNFVPFLMLNRDGLTILLHPETGDDYTDHTAHAAWFGAVLPLRIEVFGKRQ
jgi:aromatic ring-cleaving dioxygenase